MVDLNTFPIPETDENGNVVTSVVADAKSYGAKLGGIGRLITYDEYAICASIPGVFHTLTWDELECDNFWVAHYSIGVGDAYCTYWTNECSGNAMYLSASSVGVRPAIEISSSMVS